MSDLSTSFHRYSYSLVTQGKHTFYSLTIPSDVLAQSCFVSTRDEDPIKGFQRVLDEKRAIEIATYIDGGLGTIPNAIILSAQPDAKLIIDGKKKTLGFQSGRSFLVLDGQHRVYGFTMAKTSLRVPVIIYNNLSRRDETRLFIDINTKQRAVSNELLLDIKSLAEYENDAETVMRELFDSFLNDPVSPLLGKLTPASRSAGKLTRVTFNQAFKPLIPMFSQSQDDNVVYEATKTYLLAFVGGLQKIKSADAVTNATVFKAIMQLFPEAARRVKDRKGSVYTADNFAEVLAPLFLRLKPQMLKKPGASYKALHDTMDDILRKSFSL